MAEPTQPTPVRRYPRYRTSTIIIVYHGSDSRECNILQISRGGCLVVPTLPFQQSSEVRLSFRLSDDLPAINCKGEIVYGIRDKGTGIAFTEISVYNQDLITSHFESQVAGDTAKQS